VNEAPLLSPDDVAQELNYIHRKQHRTSTTAIFARGAPGTVSVKYFDGSTRTFAVEPIHCELDLRRALARKGAEDLALLVDYPTERLPADIQGRIANGRVYGVDRGRRLARIFGATSVSTELLACRPLCDALLRDPRPLGGAFFGTTVDLHAGWRALLYRAAGVDRDGELTEDALLARAAIERPPPGGEALGPATDLGKALSDHLQRVVGPVAPIAWAAWLAGVGPQLAAVAFLLDAGAKHLARDAGLRNAVTVALRAIDPAIGVSSKPDFELLARWGALAEKLTRRIADARALDTLLARADAIVPDTEMAASLRESRFLASAFMITQQRLAGALREAVSRPQPDTIAAAREELQRLALHRLANAGAGLQLVARARMALRLVAYLHARPNLAEESHGSYGAVFRLSQHYVDEGGFVDHARELARGPAENELEKAIALVLEAVDTLRDADDDTFGRAYADWLSAGASDGGKIVTIAKAIDQLVVPFLKAYPHRRVLVALLDGMSWANAVELVTDLEERRFGLLRQEDAAFKPVLAALPTLTGVSRSSFFAGKAIRSGEVQDTSKDPERFAAHAGLRKIGIENAPLYLKDLFASKSGDLSEMAGALVRSDARVVGVVVNAIDDELKSTNQMRRSIKLDVIKPLGRLLEAATEANRAVLLVADHGHIRASRLQSIGRGGDGKRYRYLGDSDATVPQEIVLNRDVAWVERGKTRVALLAKESDGYGASACFGEHGGLSLAEVVAPAVFIGSDELRQRVDLESGHDDKELDVRPLPRPGWWDLEVAVKRAAKRAPTPKPMPPIKPRANQEVLPLFQPPLSEEVGESAFLVRLRASKAFEDRSAADRKRFGETVAPRIDVLHAAGGVMSVDVFANRAKVLARNVSGVVSEMGEWINFDQFLIVEHDPISKRVKLDIAKLEAYLGEYGT